VTHIVMLVVIVLFAAGVFAAMASAIGNSPRIANESSYGVTQSTAVLNATLNPRGEDTTYQFEYDTRPYTTGAGSQHGIKIPALAVDVGAGITEEVVGQPLEGLEPNTVYHYRIVVTNNSGSAEGDDESFETLPERPPDVTTGVAIEVSQNTATLIGTVDAHGVPTSYEFDFGADTSYGTRIFGNAVAETEPGQALVTLQNLAAATTYHYRIQATNIYGVSYGADEVFTTSTFPTSLITSPSTTRLLAAPRSGSGTAVAASRKILARVARHASGRPIYTRTRWRHKHLRGLIASNSRVQRHGGKVR
jgi:hypothetical protein